MSEAHYDTVHALLAALRAARVPRGTALRLSREALVRTSQGDLERLRALVAVAEARLEIAGARGIHVGLERPHGDDAAGPEN